MTTNHIHPIAKTISLSLVAISLSSCVIEVPESNSSPNASSSAAVSQSANPRLETNPNGTIRATYPGDSRYAVFDSNGNLIEGGPNCNDEDLFRAKQAVRAYLGR
jgi:hypothetical protein